MSAGQKFALAAFVGIFIAAKVFFLWKTPKSFLAAAIPAALLILSDAQSTSAADMQPGG